MNFSMENFFSPENVLWPELQSTNLSINGYSTFFYVIIYLELLFCFQHETITDTKMSRAVVNRTLTLCSALQAVHM